jgi:hypothetical protein
MKQHATTSNKPVVDFTYGFPGRIPRKEKQQQFLIEFAKGGDQQAAARAAGYSLVWAKRWAARLIKQYNDYVSWLQASRAQAIVKEINVDQKMVLDEMARIAFANEFDYLVFYEKEEIDEKTQRPTGRKVPWARRKYVHELTREQLSAVVVFRRGDKGSIDWRWRDRDGKLYELGKHLGMFNEKLIHEHRHRHLHAHFDLSGASTKELEALEGQFETLLKRDGDATK